MKLTVELFLFDNALMNLCVYALAAAWMGVRLRTVPTVCVSLLGAVYALLSLFYLPILKAPYLKLPCFLALSLPLFRHAGPILKTLPFLLLSAALSGGTALLLTLQLGGTVYQDGTVVGTVPMRIALLCAVAVIGLPRLLRGVLRVRRTRMLHTGIEVQLASNRYRLDALIDSGNLLKEPITGLPVILLDREVDNPSAPIPFAKLSGSGFLYGERPVFVKLTAFQNVSVDCFCARAPEKIGSAEAILPECLLPYDWRIQHDSMASPHLGTPAWAFSRWQTRYLMVRSFKRKPSAAARRGGGGEVHCACADRQGGEG